MIRTTKLTFNIFFKKIIKNLYLLNVIRFRFLFNNLYIFWIYNPKTAPQYTIQVCKKKKNKMLKLQKQIKLIGTTSNYRTIYHIRKSTS